MEASQVSTDRGMDKQTVMYVLEYNSAIKRKEILPSAKAWMNLGDTALSEISQSQKDKYCMIPLLGGTHRVDKFLETESWMVIARASGKWGVES